jgi:hypothetical protein
MRLSWPTGSAGAPFPWAPRSRTAGRALGSSAQKLYSRSPAASRASFLVAYSLRWRMLPSRMVNTLVSSRAANATRLPKLSPPQRSGTTT